MALLIPILRSNKEALESALDRIAPYDWAESRKIHVFPVDKQQSGNIGQILSEYCQANNIGDILIPKRLHCDEKFLQDVGYRVLMGPSAKALIYGQALREHLGQFGFDWRSEATARLSRYALGAIGKEEIDSWLAQFERLGNHRAVGEHLLQLLEVLPLADLGDSLSSDSGFYGADLVVGFNNDKWGKSWTTVSNLIRKKCASASLLPIAEAIEKGGYPKVLRLVEDGLFSGTEIRAVFDSLRGTRRPGRSQKVPQLSDVSVLSKVPTQIRFAVVCDFGEAVLRRYMALNSLPNVQIIVSAAARKICVLRGETGLVSPNEVAHSGHDEDKVFRDQLLSKVVPFAFQADKGWRDEHSRRRAKVFCEQVGEQLWRNYITVKNFSFDSWPEERIKLCSLGMDGLGLTFAFPHSIPKASLPVFWARGKVTWNGTSINWAPLFPNADT